MTHLSRLFHYIGCNLSTIVVYYKEDIIHIICGSWIGGVEGLCRNRGKAVHNICSIKLQFRDRTPVYCVFINPNKTIRLVNKKVQDENDRLWVTYWRVVKLYESE